MGAAATRVEAENLMVNSKLTMMKKVLTVAVSFMMPSR
jgi:hypothetical protein